MPFFIFARTVANGGRYQKNLVIGITIYYRISRWVKNGIIDTFFDK
jgi:hypothetical protein